MKPYPMMTHPLGLAARRFARHLGLTRVIGRLISSDKYEERFSTALLAEIRPGDCVWDVGANVGYYTTRFSRAVGPNGRVVAFEPSPRSYPVLKRNCADGYENVIALEYGLGSSSAHLPFILSDDASGVTDQIGSASHPSSASSTLLVSVTRGDELVEREPSYLPNVMKIDVEGFEVEVLTGLGDRLGDRALRAIFVEVHFGALDKRGMVYAPADIARNLKDAGFKVLWLDHSHLVARRTP